MGIISLGNQRPSEIAVPPPSIAPPPDNPFNIAGVLSGDRTPPTYVYTQRREPAAGPSFLMAPWDNYDVEYELKTGWQDAPDPIRQSDFYAAGNKIKPWAHMPIVTEVAFGSIEAVMENTFHVGKLLGYWHRPMYQGQQHPSVLRSNIQEALPTTYGSMYEVSALHPLGGPVTPTGFGVAPVQSIYTDGQVDGYPY